MLDLVAKLKDVPGVVAVALGGSRASDAHRPDSDWDFALYYRDSIDTDYIRRQGFEGHVTEPGEWGRLVNGGAWLLIDGERVDLLYRDIEVVTRWRAAAGEGRFEIDRVPGHIAGLPTYVLAAELALGKVLYGELPECEYPKPLRESAPRRWTADAAFALVNAEGAASTGDDSRCLGLLVQAFVCRAHAILAGAGTWVVNEKGIIEKAGLRDAWTQVLEAAANGEWRVATSVARSVLEISPPEGLALDR